MIEQPQSDTNIQPNQIEPKLPYQIPALMGLVHCYLAHLHLYQTQQNKGFPPTYSIQGSIQLINISKSVQLYNDPF